MKSWIRLIPLLWDIKGFLHTQKYKQIQMRVLFSALKDIQCSFSVKQTVQSTAINPQLQYSHFANRKKLIQNPLVYVEHNFAEKFFFFFKFWHWQVAKSKQCLVWLAAYCWIWGRCNLLSGRSLTSPHRRRATGLFSFYFFYILCVCKGQIPWAGLQVLLFFLCYLPHT